MFYLSFETLLDFWPVQWWLTSSLKQRLELDYSKKLMIKGVLETRSAFNP